MIAIHSLLQTSCKFITIHNGGGHGVDERAFILAALSQDNHGSRLQLHYSGTSVSSWAFIMKLACCPKTSFLLPSVLAKQASMQLQQLQKHKLRAHKKDHMEMAKRRKIKPSGSILQD